MYTSIEIDFDVYKAITLRRNTPDVSENDVLRELLSLTPSAPSKTQSNGTQNQSGIAWTSKGVTFPHGTKFRTVYRGQSYHALVENGALVYEGKRYKSPSAAATAITGNALNGWIFWECQMPNKSDWIQISKLRKNDS